MRLLRSAIAILTVAFPAAAWNFSGHWIVGEIAYERLTPQARARVDELIRRHADFERFSKDAPADPPARTICLCAGRLLARSEPQRQPLL